MMNEKMNITPKEVFTYWFKRIGATKDWGIYYNDKQIGILHEGTEYILNLEISDDSDSAIIIDSFLEYKKHRPEYKIGDRLNHELIYGNNAVNDEIMNQLKSEINTQIIGCCYLAYDDSIAEKISERAIKWLESTDFYRAPASTKYHECEPSGLIKHTLKVIDKITELSAIYTYEKVNLGEAILAAICHDFCKINKYEPYHKNVKNEQTGVWEQELSYKYKKSDIPLGHGVTSMFIAMKLFHLTTEQAAAIRWHMNEYNVCDAEKQDLMDANEKFRMVTMLQTADRLSII